MAAVVPVPPPRRLPLGLIVYKNGILRAPLIGARDFVILAEVYRVVLGNDLVGLKIEVLLLEVLIGVLVYGFVEVRAGSVA